jgi:2-(1,2-epoxy-1,2-dihydrophenyl)acetyl-CoA isomerase
VGLSPDGSSTYFLPRLVGLRRAQELILTNRTLTAQEACDWGLLTSVTGDADLSATASAIASSLAGGSVSAHGAAKELLASTFARALETQMELEGRQIAAAACSVDGQEGIRAFIERRSPRFS